MWYNLTGWSVNIFVFYTIYDSIDYFVILYKRKGVRFADAGN